MASGAKTALMFALTIAMVMAIQAGNHNVSCTNHYCKHITVNDIVIGTGLTVGILVDDVFETLACAMLDILGKVVVSTCDTLFLLSNCVPLLKQVSWDQLKDE
jgi:hypothetical protein